MEDFIRYYRNIYSVFGREIIIYNIEVSSLGLSGLTQPFCFSLPFSERNRTKNSSYYSNLMFELGEWPNVNIYASTPVEARKNLFCRLQTIDSKGMIRELIMSRQRDLIGQF